MEHVVNRYEKKSTTKASLADRLQHWLPKIVLAPTVLVTVGLYLWLYFLDSGTLNDQLPFST